ncbi:hypothetical protein ACYCAH_02685, partial [Klebsiella pneumoniae]
APPTDTRADLRGTATRSGCENKCAKVRWRAVLSPPRLPASWVGFNATATGNRIRASSGGDRQKKWVNTHAE